MAIIKISELPPGITFDADDELVAVINGVTKKLSGLQLANSVATVGDLVTNTQLTDAINGADIDGVDGVFIENNTVINTHYTTPAGKNLHAVGPITFVDSGATSSLTVGPGQRIVIL